MKNNFFGIPIVIIILLSVTVNGRQTAESGKLTGIVTFKQTVGSPAVTDEGSVVYLLSEAGARSTPYAGIGRVMENFRMNKSFYLQRIYTTLDPSRINMLRDGLDTLSLNAARIVRGFTQMPAVSRSVADARGCYTLSLKPGKYHMLVLSGGVTSNNIVESNGAIQYRIVDVKPGGVTILDINFDRQERMMSFAPAPVGC